VPTCAQAIDLYYNEGPGGGHYKIIMGSLFKTMSWGLLRQLRELPGQGSLRVHPRFILSSVSVVSQSWEAIEIEAIVGGGGTVTWQL
jgi:hypothetical protein